MIFKDLFNIAVNQNCVIQLLYTWTTLTCNNISVMWSRVKMNKPKVKNIVNIVNQLFLFISNVQTFKSCSFPYKITNLCWKVFKFSFFSRLSAFKYVMYHLFFFFLKNDYQGQRNFTTTGSNQGTGNEKILTQI